MRAESTPFAVLEKDEEESGVRWMHHCGTRVASPLPQSRAVPDLRVIRTAKAVAKVLNPGTGARPTLSDDQPACENNHGPEAATGAECKYKRGAKRPISR